MKTVAIIPARGGSKGIPRKNLLAFCGHPLIAWTITAARSTARIEGVFVTSDCREIRDVAEAYGATAIRRPGEISGDSASSESALLHALDQIQSLTGSLPERVVFLQATSPVRESEELEAAIEQFEREALDSLFSGSSPEDFCLWTQEGERLASLNYDFRTRRPRQEASQNIKLWIETGSFYIVKSAALISSGNRLSGRLGVFPVPIWKSFEIDSLESFQFCELLMRHYGLDQRYAILRSPSMPSR